MNVCLRETENERRHRLLGLAEEATADVVIVIRMHLYQKHGRSASTAGLSRTIRQAVDSLTELQAILPQEEP